MNIIFLARDDPKDIHNWSGTLYHIYHKLIEKHHVEIIGTELFDQLFVFRNGNFPQDFFLLQDRYVKNLGRLLSERINALKFDLLFFGDLFFIPLDIDIPFVHFGDLTYEQLKVYYVKEDERDIEPCINLEKILLNTSSKIIYCSKWIKNRVVEIYNINPNKIDVVEMGANIPTPQNYSIEINMDVCRLVFIGINWNRKGGDIVMQVFQHLKKEGFPCTLTIIGSSPRNRPEDNHGLTVIPFLDKAKKDHLKVLNDILNESHFLVLPTRFDAYGIVFCEASAYGVPSIAADVGGVGQPVCEGKNGFLLPLDATVQDYAEKIKSVFNDRENYIRLRASSRREFETRLNWDVWGERVNPILESTVKEWKEQKMREDNSSQIISTIKNGKN